jgi:hypothetical protein
MTTSPRGPRWQRALVLRDALLPWLREHGTLSRRFGHSGLEAAIADFRISLRTPFSRRHTPNGWYKAWALQHGSAIVTLPYGLDIWLPDKKVMNCEWEQREETKELVIQLISFRGGEWEDHLLQALTAAEWRSQ